MEHTEQHQELDLQLLFDTMLGAAPSTAAPSSRGAGDDHTQDTLSHTLLRQFLDHDDDLDDNNSPRSSLSPFADGSEVSGYLTSDTFADDPPSSSSSAYGERLLDKQPGYCRSSNTASHSQDVNNRKRRFEDLSNRYDGSGGSAASSSQVGLPVSFDDTQPPPRKRGRPRKDASTPVNSLSEPTATRKEAQRLASANVRKAKKEKAERDAERLLHLERQNAVLWYENDQLKKRVDGLSRELGRHGADF